MNAAAHSAVSGGSENPYADTALIYRRAGWGGPLPLPYGKKEKVPVDTNKRTSPYPKHSQIEEWRGRPEPQNICVRCAGVDDTHEIVGVDVDHYAKGNREKFGFDQLQQLQKKLGELPDTWTATARNDGKSGIRFFRVPRGLAFRGQAAADIEVIRKGHRYAVVWPSIHPDGGTYWWYPPGTEPLSHNRDAWDGKVPDPRTFAKLPDAWIDYLTEHRTRADDQHSDHDSSVDEIYQWATDTFHGDDDSPPCNLMRSKLDDALRKLRRSNTFHNLLTDAHWSLLHLALEGHQGWNKAVNEYEKAYLRTVTARGGSTDRTDETLLGEIFRSRIEALRKIKSKCDDRRAIGATPVDASCEKVGCRSELPDAFDAADKASGDPIFRQFGPTEWAQPVPPTMFLVKRVLSTDTWGVNSGPKKSLKTHDNQAIGLAVATGTNLYNDARFTVERPGKVVYIVGEGGQNQVRRTLHRMLRAYGIKPDEVANDPDFPFVVYHGAAPLDSLALRDEMRALLDFHQPTLVLMESFYNFHPAAVNAANLYERGQLIDSYHKLIRSGGTDVVSLLTDHHKKSASGTDLDQISMSGQAENVDSWIIRDHRNPPDVQNGEFWLTTGFSGRDWGGNTFDIDWHLGPFDHDAGAHCGEISWDVNEHNRPRGSSAQAFSMLRTDILALINGNPWRENRDSLIAKLKKNRQIVKNEISAMLVDNIIAEDTPKNRGASGRALVFGPGPAMNGAGSKFTMPRLP